MAFAAGTATIFFPTTRNSRYLTRVSMEDNIPISPNLPSDGSPYSPIARLLPSRSQHLGTHKPMDRQIYTRLFLSIAAPSVVSEGLGQGYA